MDYIVTIVLYILLDLRVPYVSAQGCSGYLSNHCFASDSAECLPVGRNKSFSLGRHDHSTATKLPPPNSLLEKGRKTLTSRIMALLAKFHGSERAGLNLRKGKQYTGTKKLKTHLKKIELHEFWTPQANRDSSLETRPKWDLSKQLGPRRRLVHPPCNQSTEVMVQSSLHRAAHGDPTPDLIVASRAMIEPSAAPRQLVTKPLFLVFLGFAVGGGDVDVPVNLLTSCMLRELRGCLGYIYNIAHVYLYIIYIYIYTYTYTYVSTT